MAKHSKKRRTGVHHGPSILELVAQGDRGWDDYTDAEDDHTTVTHEVDSMRRHEELHRVAKLAARWMNDSRHQNSWRVRELAAGRQLFEHYFLEAELPDSALESLVQSQIKEIRTQFAVLCIGNNITGLPAQDTDWYREEEPLARQSYRLRLTERSSSRPSRTRSRRHAA